MYLQIRKELLSKCSRILISLVSIYGLQKMDFMKEVVLQFTYHLRQIFQI